MNVLITGGSGYLGQFLVHGLAGQGYTVHYAYGSRQLASAPPGVVAHKVDLATGEGLQEAFDQAPFHAVINCAAISQPAVCENSPDTARAVNVPSHLVDCLLRQEQVRAGLRAVLVHISTDQVYDGSRAHWKEDEAGGQVNVYGRTKYEAETHILSRLPEPYPVAILRSSIIYGPPAPDPVPRPLFLQFVASAVSNPDKPTSFFQDEYRSPVHVRDLQRITELLIAAHGQQLASEAAAAAAAARGGGQAAEAAAVPARALEALAPEALAAVAARRHRVFNAGGPERLSRVDMARQVADCLGCGYDSIESVPSASVARWVQRVFGGRGRGGRCRSLTCTLRAS
ncbi:hypothetical protein HYH02_005395 [Chlamydomonas schloesseri]|uniref:RmlD-like substrate binding domain-containing protein n=1 Tax=Chlamydomonas schloesseri TaxID=2026947 RepID=A0A836B7D4_9CHLO|nr:hypothetical protein HYH02_005395 [Chlamydomonas schloesseri]|eukprot:KAG2449872.1 hypothetical protein HYH02_005395 [Chlamydomonas schloesseri]